MTIQEKLDQMILQKQEVAARAYKALVEQGKHLNDHVIDSSDLSFRVNGKVTMRLLQSDELDIHQHALGQIADRFNIPIKYVKLLNVQSDWKKNLLNHILNQHSANGKSRYLVRSVDNQVRGFLSNRYKRLNSVQIYSTFIKAANAIGAKVVDAFTSDTRGYLSVVMPEAITVQTPNNGTHEIAFGARMRNSDFGDGALDISLFTIRILCTNGMIGNSIFNEIHLSKELPKNIALSERTYQLDTMRTISVVDDACKFIFSGDLQQYEIEKLINSSKHEINIKKEVEELPKIGVLKSEVDSVMNILMGGSEEAGTQGKPTAFKLANAVSAVGNTIDNEQRRMDLHDISGKILMKHAPEMPKFNNKPIPVEETQTILL